MDNVIIIEASVNKAKEFYNNGRYVDARTVLDKILNNKNNSDFNEALKFKIVVDNALKAQYEQEIKKAEDLNKLRAEKERKHEQWEQNLFEKNIIQYYKHIYGRPDKEHVPTDN